MLPGPVQGRGRVERLIWTAGPPLQRSRDRRPALHGSFDENTYEKPCNGLLVGAIHV